jgi:very-long-chain ceramide synthase
VTFGVFILTWFATRHVLYLMICWSIHADVPTTMPYGCYDSNTGTMLTSNATLTKSVPFDGGSEILSNVMASFREPGGVVCFNNRVRYAFLALLLGLQVITILWFTMILKVAYKVISGHGAEDVRSDDEEDEDVESESEKKIQKDMAASTGRSLATAAAIPGPMTGAPLEEEVGVEELHLGRRTSPGVRVRRTAAGANGRGASMSSSRDRKELLGRIGCDGPS